MIFRKIIWLALGVALFAGSIQSVVQYVGAIPIIEAAERFEGQKQGEAAPDTHAQENHNHSHAEAWKPTDGFERNAWTWVANVNLAFALALLVFVSLGFRARSKGLPSGSLRVGLAVAAMGFVSLYLWPALGQPPEIPGVDAPALRSRQLWWLLAAGSAAAASYAVTLTSGSWRWLAAAMLLALPFVVGSPQHTGYAFAGFSAEAAGQLQTLAGRFIVASAATAFVQWLVLGVSCAIAYKRWLEPLIPIPAAAGSI